MTKLPPKRATAPPFVTAVELTIMQPVVMKKIVFARYKAPPTAESEVEMTHLLMIVTVESRAHIAPPCQVLLELATKMPSLSNTTPRLM
eukprot:CAMPEP_0182821418 /NCGR_PEP_ID=MMETSP0006_2-20121128/13656_1 /TAXON_ID=97485 /ORGANISM="Prymnesium parvum, Strain Texoma1" /LENGTH=88 /DNA_ID=CAMNT_0024948167 /DNA_START=380 /DNA_END=646 /DNA_ORIENTATION=+